ncbi:GH25 family lysozyme [Limosilactobacillus sp.]|uniref:GH25 family lysozyme n=1 Tax=Limosilactobacillus sp. TaxID=2773925 RepID=UPI003F073A47
MPKTKTGWQKEKDGYIYYEADGTVMKGRQYRELPKINTEKEWYLTEDGKLLTGVQQWKGAYWFFNADGTLHKKRDYVQSQWGQWYMIGDNGQVLSGVQKWQGSYWYFEPSTYLKADHQEYIQSQWGTWYMVGKDGRLMSGLVDWQGSKYYFDPTTYLKVTNTDVVVDGVTYHADQTGILSVAQAAKSYGGDYSKYQPNLYNNTGQDSFAVSQIGGSVNGYIYEQGTYASHAQQAKAKGWRFHTYIWMQTGSNQAQTQAMLNYFLPRIQGNKGSIVALDYEAGASGNIEANTDNILVGMRQIKAAGYTPVLYSYKPYLLSHVDIGRVLAEFPNSIWVAGYQNGLSTMPNYAAFPSMDGVAMWQYSDYGGQQDLNVDLTGITWNGYR